MRSLVAGWFSFEQMGATAGDLYARDLVVEWLDVAGRSYDIAVAPPFEGGINWRAVDPRDYDEVVFVCGPFGNGPPLTEFLPRFEHCKLVGVNLSMLQPLEEWNPFDLLLERDSSTSTHPDITFLSHQSKVPLVGRIQVHHQTEYGGASLHSTVDQAIDHLLASRHVAVIPVDTRLDENSVGLRTPREVESVIARMDAVVTTRLHGAVLALKNGVPPLVIDPIAGGAKIARQMRAIGWEQCFTADLLDDKKLREAFDYCLTREAGTKARSCTESATNGAELVRAELIAEFRQR